MSYSIPCVAHNIDGIPELIDHGKTGFLFKKGDYEEMSNSIVTLLRNPELSKKMGICAQEKVKSFFTMEKTFRKHSKLFSEMKNKIDDN
jgi:glycosyltransferase involved in cell wall biosynthesis